MVSRKTETRYGLVLGEYLQQDSLTNRLPVRMVHVDVKWSVCGVNKYLTAGAVVFVAFLHRARVPVSPIYSVLKHSQGKRVRQVSVVHRVSVLTIQVRVSDRRNTFTELLASSYGRVKESACFQVHLLNVVEVSIGPVEPVVCVVDCNTVGPLDLCGDDGRFVGSIHSNTTYKGFVTPVCPVHKSIRGIRHIHYLTS